MNSWNASLITAVVTAIVTSILTMVAALGVSSYNDGLERSRRIEQERREVYGNLRGVGSQVESLLGASLNSRVRKEYTEAMIRILGERDPQRGIRIEEARRLVQLEEGLGVQSGQAIREFHKYVAMADVLFPASQDLRARVERAYVFNGVRIRDFAADQKESLTAENIERWYVRTNESARALLLKEFREPATSLLTYLADQMRSP